MVSLTDYQLRVVMDIAVRLDPDRRSIFLERCAAMLKFRHRFSDDDVADTIQREATAAIMSTIGDFVDEDAVERRAEMVRGRSQLIKFMRERASRPY